MPDVRMPDGTIIKNVPAGTTKEELLAKLEGRGVATPDPAADIEQEVGKPFDVVAYAQGVGDSLGRGALFGAMDEVQGATSALVDIIQGEFMDNPLDTPDVRQSERDFMDEFELFRKDAADRQNQFSEENPIVAGAAELAGALLTGSASVKAAEKAGLVGIKAMAGAGAVDGAAYGALSSDPGERMKGAAQGAMMGAGLGTALYGAGKGIKAITSKMRKPMEEAYGQAQKALDKIEDDYILHLGSRSNPGGIEGQQLAYNMALRENGMDELAYRQAVDIAGRKARFVSKEAADRLAPGIASARRNVPEIKGPGMGAKIAGVVDDVAGVASTRLQNVSKPLFGRARKYEFTTKSRQQKVMRPLHNALGTRLNKVKGKMSNEAYTSLKKALYNGERDTALSIVPAEFRPALQGMYKQLDDIGAELRSVGYKFDDSKGYWPRHVRDLDGLRAQLGREEKTQLQRFLDEAKVKKGKKYNENQEINNWLMNVRKGDGRPGFAQARTIERLSDEMVDFYDDPFQAFSRHIHSAIDDIEMKKFFDKSGAGGSLSNLRNQREFLDQLDGEGQKAIEDSISALIAREGLTDDAANEVKKVLSARFGRGRQGMGKPMAALKDVSTGTALGQIQSTVTQIGDLANSAFQNGPVNTIRGAVRALRPGAADVVTEADVGLSNVLAQDLMMEGSSKLNRAVDGALTATGFKAFDRFNKRTIAEAARSKAMRELNKHGRKGIEAQQKWMKQWGDVYGDDAQKVMDALKNGEKNDYLYEHLFNIISDVQPVSALEMPVAYMNNPNGRILYTLKSYALKQLDIVRREVYNKAKSPGERMQAAKNMIAFAGYIGAINGGTMEVKDWMQTGEFHPEDIPDNAIDSLMSLVFLGKYNREVNFQQGDYVNWAIQNLAPAAPDIAGAAEGVAEVAAGDAEPEVLAGKLPIIGRTIKYWVDEDAARDKDKRDRDTRRRREREGLGGVVSPLTPE